MNIASLLQPLFLAMLILLSFQRPVYAAGTESQLPFLSVERDQIVTSHGKIIKLRGIHYDLLYVLPKIYHDAIARSGGDAEKQNLELNKYWFSESDVLNIKALGANVVRVGFRLWELEKKPYVYSADAFAVLDDAIARFGKKGIYVILDLHAAGQNTLKHNNEYGRQLWKNKDLQNRVFALWRHISQRYKNNPYVAGYDLINEPMAPDRKSLHDFYQTCINEIRKQGDQHILFIEYNYYKVREVLYGGEYSDPNIVLSYHFYRPTQFTMQGKPGKPSGQKYPGIYRGVYWDKKHIEKNFKEGLSMSRNRPLFVGEFSAVIKNGGQDALQWIQDVMDVMNRLGVHYTYFCYKAPMQKTFALYEPNNRTWQKMGFLRKQMKKKRNNANGFNENQKMLFSTHSYESSKKLEKILSSMTD